MTNPRFVGRASLCLLFGCAALAAAAETPQAASQPAYQPATVRFDEKGLGLLDAVRLTLQHDPNIKLQEAQTFVKEGVLQEAHGQFDTTLKADASYQYLQQELTASAKQTEIKNREDLDKALARIGPLENSIKRAIDNLKNPNLVTDPAHNDPTAGVDDAGIRDQLTAIQQELMFLNDLIARTTDAKLRADLIAMRDQVVTSVLERFTSQAEQLKGLPEQLRQMRQDLGDAPVDQFQKTGTAHLELSRLLRNGILLTPYFDFNYSSSNYVGKSDPDPAKGGLGIRDLYTGQLGFEVLLPLRRGLGSDSVTASERAARADLEAARLTYLHQKSQSVASTVSAYWAVRSAVDQVEVAKRSVKLQNDLVNLTRELIKAKEMSRADEARSMASQADAQARLEAAERQLVETRVNLARVMGVALQDATATPLATDAFPAPPDTLLVDGAALATLARQAVDKRNDHKATLMQQEAGRLLAKGAKLDARRLINLDLKVFGTSVGEDKPNLGTWTFRSGSGAIQVEVPFDNNSLEGQAAQRDASLRLTTIDSADLARIITINVVRLAHSLRLAGERLKKAEEAVRQYDKTIEDEQAKFKGGDSTLVDTILTEQQTTAARLARIQAQQDYAVLLAQLRFEAGLLVQEVEGQSRVSVDSLTAVPVALQGPAPAGK